MSKRTNKIYNVTLATYANIAVEAESPEEAMKVAEKYKDGYLSSDDFDDSEIDVHSCETYPCTIDDYEDDELIYCADGVIDAEDYFTQLKEEE